MDVVVYLVRCLDSWHGIGLYTGLYSRAEREYYLLEATHDVPHVLEHLS